LHQARVRLERTVATIRRSVDDAASASAVELASTQHAGALIMSTSYRRIALSTCAPLLLGGCGADLVNPPLDPPLAAVQLSVAVDPSQAYETCGEYRVQAKATNGKQPVRGIVVNFAPLGGSVFAAAVSTNKDGVATTYWKLGRVFDGSTLIARAVDENGARVLDDTLTVEKRQQPTRLVDYGMVPHFQGMLPYEPPPPPPGVRRFVSRVRLLDRCGDPIPSALLRVRFSGPVMPLEPVDQIVPTFQFGFPDEAYWGMGIMFYNFTSVPSGRYQVTWQVVEAPELVVTNDWGIP
jgi:hypothetical protein